MSGFERRSAHGHGSYILNQQISLPISYNQGENHEYGSNGTSSYHMPQNSYNMYHQCSLTYDQNGVPSSISEPSSHPVLPTPEHEFIQHGSSQCMPQARYLESPRYLFLREATNETEIESQESLNENKMLSEPVIPPLEGFPGVREFDQLIRR
ncbi:uncharacterized protein ACLA_000730 [Aspergillus clavatus NRRL 1]|uniref:Uncharacterized protein n=1 Tax=Aspergillus clavatus (strain ATCC 1007 / CBS 513.65 / DSM 816 / NCTC 3887 / NRRL 1 / QM 1276 / 107) TaxID=344612 RepID=A1C4P4_ASPCL|nr:uncharacterized protein ACLA_000730 [Aspergillus clavatus NRRL 1]EAW14662.1 conserved hypothetical protein [Aspergillus clavatus NRRL 1]